MGLFSLLENLVKFFGSADWLQENYGLKIFVVNLVCPFCQESALHVCDV